MGAEEEVLVTLSGGAPWGFRLQGGAEQRKPLQVSKVRESPYTEVSGKGETQRNLGRVMWWPMREKWEAVEKWGWARKHVFGGGSSVSTGFLWRGSGGGPIRKEKS